MIKKVFRIVFLIVAILSLFSFYAYGEITQSTHNFKTQNFATNVCNTNEKNTLILSKTVCCITTLGNGLNISYVGANPSFPKQFNVSGVTYFINIFKGNSTIYDNLSFQGSSNIQYLCYQHGAGMYQISTYVVVDTNNSSAISHISSITYKATALLVSRPANPTELIYPGIVFGVVAVVVFILSRIYGEDTKYVPERLLHQKQNLKRIRRT